MKEFLPVLLPPFFIAIVLATTVLLFLGIRSWLFRLLVVAWLLVQGIVSYTGYYSDTSGFPPRFALLVLPPLLGIALALILPAGRRWLDTLNFTWLTWLHTVRVPVELTLYLLFLQGLVPELMTFTGRNMDVLSGLTAPLIVWYGYKHTYLDRRGLLIWNFMCLLLLINIVVHAALSVPFDFQQLAFDQPNLAVISFPYTLLPGFVVPAVLLAHAACVRNLIVRD